jgi:hypothetical protein
VCGQVMKKKPRKGAKNAKPITKTEQCESFFNFFTPPDVRALSPCAPCSSPYARVALEFPTAQHTLR